MLFNLDTEETVRRSYISDRLFVVDAYYFKKIFDTIYSKFSKSYTISEIEKYNLIHVDSTMVCETVGKLVEGLEHKSGKKAVKYSVSFDGLLPSDLQVFTASAYTSEDIA